ncbi:hypothetical protein X298_02165 [Oenococcus oeni IOEB_L65_2]|nr:hypothetical protein X298_02165 [Oenococcus oeni IOEB_L65_2]
MSNYFLLIFKYNINKGPETDDLVKIKTPLGWRFLGLIIMKRVFNLFGRDILLLESCSSGFVFNNLSCGTVLIIQLTD